LTTRFAAHAVCNAIQPDVILEEINTLPYLAPVWSAAPVLLYMNQLARQVWWYEAPWPVALVGWLSEPIYLRAYRNCPAITISSSSRDDLRALGLRREITVAPMAVDVQRAESLPEKRRVGAMIAIGRLTPSKRYDHAIDALALLAQTHPEASLTLVGSGRSRSSLESYAQKRNVTEVVRFVGGVSDGEKVRLLDAADVLIGTSVREGWGLTVTEAAARGTASILYDIPGFRDAVVPGRTGILVEPKPEALASCVRSLIDDGERFDRLRKSAWLSVEDLTFTATVNAFEHALAVSQDPASSS
jgi:glycosyltransferase involved in cell wall biosynthesis